MLRDICTRCHYVYTGRRGVCSGRWHLPEWVGCVGYILTPLGRHASPPHLHDRRTQVVAVDTTDTVMYAWSSTWYTSDGVGGWDPQTSKNGAYSQTDALSINEDSKYYEEATGLVTHPTAPYIYVSGVSSRTINNTPSGVKKTIGFFPYNRETANMCGTMRLLWTSMGRPGVLYLVGETYKNS